MFDEPIVTGYILPDLYELMLDNADVVLWEGGYPDDAISGYTTFDPDARIIAWRKATGDQARFRAVSA